jgi:hypothetical protein
MPTTQYRKSTSKKPATPQQQLDAAIKRAQDEGLKVFATCKILATGEQGWLVPSQSVPGMHHVVSRTASGSLQCDCFYSAQRGKVCAHRACVFLFLKEQNKNTPQAQPQQTGSSEDSAQPVAAPSPQAPTATLGVAKPTATPQGVLAANTAPKITLPDDAWGRYQDARMRGFDQDFWPSETASLNTFYSGVEE